MSASNDESLIKSQSSSFLLSRSRSTSLKSLNNKKVSVKQKVKQLKQKLETIEFDDVDVSFNELLKREEEEDHDSNDSYSDEERNRNMNNMNRNKNNQESYHYLKRLSTLEAVIDPSTVARDLEVKIYECEKLYKDYECKKLSSKRARKAGRGTVDPVITVHVKNFETGKEYCAVSTAQLNTVDPVWMHGDGEAFSFPIFSEQVLQNRVSNGNDSSNNGIDGENAQHEEGLFSNAANGASKRRLKSLRRKETLKKKKEEKEKLKKNNNDTNIVAAGEEDEHNNRVPKEVVFKIWDLKGPSEIESEKSLIGTCTVPIALCPLDGTWREFTLDVQPASEDYFANEDSLTISTKELKKLASKKRMEKNKQSGGEGTLRMAFRRPPKLLPALGVDGNWHALQVNEGAEDPLEPWVDGAENSVETSSKEKVTIGSHLSIAKQQQQSVVLDSPNSLNLKMSFKSFSDAKRSEMYEKRRGRYYVHIMNASHITQMDGWSGSDPYVKIGTNSINAAARFKTKVKNNTCFPKWDERFLVDLTSRDDTALVFTMFDADFGKRDDFCGACGLPLDCLPQDGSYRTFNLPLATRISPKVAGEVAIFEDYERRLNVGFLKVSVAKMMEPLEVQDKILEACGGFGSITLEDSGNLTKYARRCHVRVLAARYLLPVGNRSKDVCDPSVSIQVDNAPSFERFSTSVVYDTSTPVWNDGLGEMFTLLVRPGAKELRVICVDRNGSKSIEMGRGTVNLLNVAADGEWTNAEVELSRHDPKDRDFYIPSGIVSIQISSSRAPFPEIVEPPVIDVDKKMMNVHDPSLYLYVQVLRHRDIALPPHGKHTDLYIQLTTNTNLQNVCGKVQEDVARTANFDTEVFSLPMNPMTSSFRIRLVAELKTIYFGVVFVKAWKQFQRYLYGGDGADSGASFVDLDGDGQLDDPEEALAIKAEDFTQLKKFFVGGTKIGEFTIDTTDLAIGELRRTWAKLIPAKNQLSMGYLNKVGKQLGHVEVAYSIGRRSVPPTDLEISTGSARPQIGSLNVQIKSVIGGVQNSGNPAKDTFYKQNVLKNAIEKDEGLLGTHISCAVIIERFEEKFRTAYESATFPVTEIMGEVRIILFVRDPVTTAFTKPVGVACVPLSSVLKSEKLELDVWANVMPTDSDGLSEQDLLNAECEMYMRERNKKTVAKNWQGYCRVVLKFNPATEKNHWYLRQAPLERPKEKPEDTVIGILNAMSRLALAIFGFPQIVMQSFAWLSLWPLNETIVIRSYCAFYYTLLCFYLRGDIIGAFLPLLIVQGILFIGYTSRIVEDKDESPVSCFGVNEDGSEKEILRERVIDEFTKTKAIEKEIDEEIEDLFEYSRLVKMGKSHKEASKQVSTRAAKRIKADRENAELSGNNPVQKLKNVLKSLRAKTNPMDFVLKMIKKLLSFCVNVIKSITKTAISLDKVQSPRILSAPCLAVITPLDAISQPLERMIGVLDFRDENLSNYAAALMIIISVLFGVILKFLMFLRKFLDSYSPIRIWFFVWLLGVLLLIPQVSNKVLFPIVVAYEHFVQYNFSASGIHIPSVCLASIQEVDKITRGRVSKLFEGDEKDREKARDELFQKRKEAYVKDQAAKIKKRKMSSMSAMRGYSSNPAQFLPILMGRSLTARQETHRSRIEKLFVINLNKKSNDDAVAAVADDLDNTSLTAGLEEQMVLKPDFNKIANIKVNSSATKRFMVFSSLPKLIVASTLSIPRRVILSPIVMKAALEKVIPSRRQVKQMFQKLFAPMSKNEKTVKGVGKIKNLRMMKNGKIFMQDDLKKAIAERRATKKKLKKSLSKAY